MKCFSKIHFDLLNLFPLSFTLKQIIEQFVSPERRRKMSESENESGDFSHEYEQEEEHSQMSDMKKAQEKIDWNAPADLPYKVLIVGFSRTFRPEELMIKSVDKNGNTQLRLKDRGRLVFSLSKGSLSLEQGDKQDFEKVIQAINDRNNLNCVKDNTTSSKKNDIRGKGTSAREYKDLIKSIDAFQLTSTWKKECVMEFDTIPVLQNEYNRGNTGVSISIKPGVLSPTKAISMPILSREITNYSMLFNKKFGGINQHNLEETMTTIGLNKERVYVPFQGPIHIYRNLAFPSNQHLNQPISLGDELHIEMPKTEALNAISAVKDKIASTVSLGNVKDLKFSLYVPIPHERLEAHNLFKTDKTKGAEFYSFADAEYALPGGTKEEQATFMKTYQSFHGQIKIMYLPQ